MFHRLHLGTMENVIISGNDVVGTMLASSSVSMALGVSVQIRDRTDYENNPGQRVTEFVLIGPEEGILQFKSWLMNQRSQINQKYYQLTGLPPSSNMPTVIPGGGGRQRRP
jgi:hypothetical protein